MYMSFLFINLFRFILTSIEIYKIIKFEAVYIIYSVQTVTLQVHE